MKILPILILTLFACNSSDNDQSVPDLFVSKTEFQEGDVLNSISVEFTIQDVHKSNLSFNYTIVEGSALQGVDYVSSSGTLEIATGSLSTNVIIEIVGDEHLELTENFFFVVSVDGVDNKYELFIKDDDEYYITKDSNGYVTPLEYPSMQLVWNDEFDGTDINATDWGYDLGNGCDKGICGWGNEELQIYTDLPENVRLEDGDLIITALNNQGYTSARILTEGKREFQYGRIDIRAKLPFGQGIWPAIWMLGTNINTVGWPVCGEIDIMELVGNKPTTVHGTIHYDNDGYASKTSVLNLSGQSLSDEYHVYSIIWERNLIKWYVDYQLFHTVTQEIVGESYPFNNPNYLLLNVAVGGRWPGDPDESTVFPQKMVVDYIRVFQ